MTRTPYSLARLGLSGSLAALLVSACAVGPDYVPPHTELAAFHNPLDPPAASKADPVALDAWWLGFDDPDLVRVVERALEQNLDLAASLARVEQARAAAGGAGARLLPSVDVNASAGAARQSLQGPSGLLSQLPGFERDVETYAIGPSASWEIDLFGGLRRDASASRNAAEAVEADYVGVRLMVAADTADAYLQVRGYQSRLAVAQAQVSTSERLLRLVNDRYAAGSGTGREVAQAEALLQQARASLPPLRIGLEQQLNRLDVLMGVQPGAYAREFDDVRPAPSIPAIDSGEAVDLLRRRPDVIAAERRLAASNERIGAAISDYYPKLSLSGALGFETVGGGDLFASTARQATGGGALRWRLFDFGRIDAEVRQARGANAEALALYRLSVLRAAEDVENAMTVLSQTEVRRLDVERQVQALVRARDLSERAYRAGAIPLTDVLDADRQLLVARDEANASRANAARAAVGVFRALGGGWTPPSANAGSAGAN